MKINCLSLSGLLLVSCLFGSLTGNGESGEEARLTSLESPHFEIIGAGVRSVSFIARLSTYIVESTAHLLPDIPPDFPQRILVVLRTPEDLDFEGDSRIQIANGGFVRLDIVWNDELSLERCVQLVNESFLVRYVIFNSGLEAPDKMKAWAVAALGAEAYIGLRAAMVEAYQWSLASRALPDPSTLLSKPYDFKTTIMDLRYVYPVVTGLKDMGVSRKQFSRMISTGLAGGDISGSIGSIIEQSNLSVEPLSLEQWWVGACTDFIRIDEQLFEPMEVSEPWIREMYDFSSVEGVEIENVRSLWGVREVPELRDLLAARLELIYLRIDRVNPAYFNAVRGLGAFYEAVLRADSKHEFISAWAVFLRDFDDARELRAKVVERVGSE